MTGNIWAPSSNWGDPAMEWLRQQIMASQGQGPGGQTPQQTPQAPPQQDGPIASQSPFAQGSPLAWLMPQLKMGGNSPIAGMMPQNGPHGLLHSSAPQSPTNLDAGGNPIGPNGAPWLPPDAFKGAPMVGGQGAMPVPETPPNYGPTPSTPLFRTSRQANPGAPSRVADPHSNPAETPGAPSQVADPHTDMQRDPQIEQEKSNATYGGGSSPVVPDRHDEEQTQPPVPGQVADAGGNDANAQAPGKGGVGTDWLSKLASGFNNPITQMGLGMMAAGGRRGSTFLGAVGEGGMYASEQQRKTQEMQLRQQQLTNESEYRQGMLGLEGKKLQQTGAYQQGELGVRADAIRAQLQIHGANNQTSFAIAKMVDDRDRQLSSDRVKAAQAQHDDDAANKMIEQWQQSYNNTMRAPDAGETKAFKDRLSLMFPRSSAVTGWRANDTAQMIQGINADKTLSPQQRQERVKFLMDQLNQQMRQ